jgi:hypothetical protein
MKIFVFLGAGAVALLSFHAPASAYERPYCMEVSMGGGGSRIDCAYESFEQCYASKVDISSTCSRNPRWYGVPDGPPRHRKRHS